MSFFQYLSLHLPFSLTPLKLILNTQLTPSHRTFLNLTPRTRLLVGTSFLAWGTLGLYLTDRAESTLGFEATEQDREALKSTLPRITVVEREGEREER